MKKMGISIWLQAGKKELTITKIANKTGLTRRTIYRLWRGKEVKSVDFSTLEKIAQVLDCSPLDFLYTYDETEDTAK